MSLWVSSICDYCNEPIKHTRAVYRKNKTHYCNDECYYASLENPSLVMWRQGSRLARALVSQRFDLQREHIVHHEDTDQRHNDMVNLRVFKDQADHMRYHRGGNAIPIWDGSKH